MQFGVGCPSAMLTLAISLICSYACFVRLVVAALALMPCRLFCSVLSVRGLSVGHVGTGFIADTMYLLFSCFSCWSIRCLYCPSVTGALALLRPIDFDFVLLVIGGLALLMLIKFLLFIFFRQRGINHMLVEGGPSVAKGFLWEELVDRAIIVRAPVEFPRPVPSGMTSRTLEM